MQEGRTNKDDIEALREGQCLLCMHAVHTRSLHGFLNDLV